MKGLMMKRFFSAQGAKRGFMLAVLSVLLWGCWAIGYLQGLDGAVPPSALWIWL